MLPKSVEAALLPPLPGVNVNALFHITFWSLVPARWYTPALMVNVVVDAQVKLALLRKPGTFLSINSIAVPPELTSGTRLATKAEGVSPNPK